MNGAPAGSRWWGDPDSGADAAADTADDAADASAADPPVDARTTQQFPRIDRTDGRTTQPTKRVERTDGRTTQPTERVERTDGRTTQPTKRDEPTDGRTTQPTERVERTDGDAPSSPWPSTDDTIRIETPAWFLRAQQRAAEQADAAADTDAGSMPESPAAGKPAEPDAAPDTGADEVGAGPVPPPVVREAARPAGYLDPTVAASYREPTPPPDLPAGMLGLLGAVMLAVGSFLTWGRSSGVVEASITGTGGSNGWGTLACGVVVGLGAALVLAGRRNALVGGAMLVAAVVAVYLCGFSGADIARTGNELPDMLVGVGVDRDDAANATLELTRGFAVVAAGAAAALAGGVIAFARRV